MEAQPYHGRCSTNIDPSVILLAGMLGHSQPANVYLVTSF